MRIVRISNAANGKAASYVYARDPLCDSCPAGFYAGLINKQEFSMGKYLIAWILGVPAIVLVVAYFFLG